MAEGMKAAIPPCAGPTANAKQLAVYIAGYPAGEIYPERKMFAAYSFPSFRCTEG